MTCVRVDKLELHATHSCNLHCISCSHLTNHVLGGHLSPEEADKQMSPWYRRLDVEMFSILGGEPTLNPRLTEVVAAVVKRFPNVMLVTNGFFLNKHPDIGRVLSFANCGILSISVHQEPISETVRAAIELGKKWHNKYGVHLDIRRYTKNKIKWSMRYNGSGNTMRPYHDESSSSSWERCNCKKCFQLHEGKIWKCPPVAYLPLAAQKYEELRTPWADWLTYVPLSPEATDAEVEEFIRRGRGPEKVCELCPAKPQHCDPNKSHDPC